MEDLDDYRMTKKELKKHKKEWIRFINKSSFSHLITLTFPPNIHENECRTMMWKFLERLSRKFFGKKEKHGKLEGFIFKERQIKGQIHKHIILKRNQKFFVEGKQSFKYHFETLICKLSHILPNGESVSFSPNHCDLTDAYGDHGQYDSTYYRLTNYLLKTYRIRGNFDFIEPI